jgi:hypothetical protein
MLFHGVNVCETFMTLATLRVRYLSVEFFCVIVVLMKTIMKEVVELVGVPNHQ